jgi:hypothetical protein
MKRCFVDATRDLLFQITCVLKQSKNVDASEQFISDP